MKEVELNTFAGERRDQFFELLKTLIDNYGCEDHEMTDQGWIGLFEHLRFVNEKADLMELSTKEMIIRFVFESVSKDPNRLLPLLKNHKKEPPTH